MAGIFISYRREDSAGHAGRICAWLKQRLGDESVFMDVDGIEPGEDYVAAVQRRIAAARLVLVVIGRQWSSLSDGRGRRRLSVSDDLVRLEVAAAIESGVRVVPVLVSGATMPPPGDLPRAIAGLARLNALEIRDQAFEQGMERLAAYIDRWDVAQVAAKGLEPSPSPPEPQRDEADPTRSVAAEPLAALKVSMVGAAGVGKTSLVKRFVYSTFSESYLTTIGVHVSRKNVTVGARPLSMIIWDIAGQEDGSPVRLDYVRGSRGLILVADGCRRKTIEDAEDLRRRIVEAFGPVPSVLAVNKVDLHGEWQIRMEELEALARAGPAMFTTSAKTGKAVEELFVHLARAMVV
jgi:small GTP-binding protein